MIWTPINDKWGYIWGTAGVKWTQAKQTELEKTTDSDREMGRKYGSKWIGHMVADCSGFFVWLYKQFGQSIAHGSNSIWGRYLDRKGTILSGTVLRAGTAVFRTKGSDRHHIGLYVGDNLCIELQGTQAGAVTSLLSSWDEWGELKAVDYEPDQPVPAGKAVVNASAVALRTGPSTKCSVITRVPKGATVDFAAPPEGWERISYNGQTGYMMSEFLKKGEE